VSAGANASATPSGASRSPNHRPRIPAGYDIQGGDGRGGQRFGRRRSVSDLASVAMPTRSEPVATAHVTINPKILYFGTPVVLLSTENDDGSANLAPISSAWALGHAVVLGLGAQGQSGHNLTARRDMVINLPTAHQWQAVERLAPLTGRHPVPAAKRDGFRYEPDKFTAAGLREQPSTQVRPPRVADCPLQLEARASRIHAATDGGFLIVEAQVVAVHADASIVVPGTDHIDPGAWNPLIYNFRHYFGLGPQRGHSFRSETRHRA
jgi:flavin reductase (DIM6/NTAB) family NADH-FMN oxidoreductase RutF